jgi:hypothetical protein
MKERNHRTNHPYDNPESYNRLNPNLSFARGFWAFLTCPDIECEDKLLPSQSNNLTPIRVVQSFEEYKANLLEKSEAQGALLPGFGGKRLIDFSLYDTYLYGLWDTHRSELNGIPANDRTNRDIVRSARLEQTLALVEEAMILTGLKPIDGEL